MNYYKKNKEVLLEKAYDKYHNKGRKERKKRYYLENNEEIKKIKDKNIGLYHKMRKKL